MTRRRVAVLARYNIPAPVIGGPVVALVLMGARAFNATPVAFDTTLQTPLMSGFFTAVGFGASFSLLRVGGPQVVIFFLVATGVALLQNVVGILLAAPWGLHPLFGVLAGSVTLTGGPATGLAFAPLFEEAGVSGAAPAAIAAAMGGIVAGGLIGGPIGTRLVERRAPPARPLEPRTGVRTCCSNTASPCWWRCGPDPTLSRGMASLGITLPAYIGAMLAAAALRNLDDATHVFRLSQRLIDDLGNVALSLMNNRPVSALPPKARV